MIPIPSELSNNILDFSNPGLPKLKKGATKAQQKIYTEWKKELERPEQENSDKLRIIEY